MGNEKLVDGSIPRNTECPYKQMCDFSCQHQGINHDVPYSCGSARAYEIIVSRNE